MEELNDGLKAILAGNLDLSTLPQMPSRVIRVYLSSNDADMEQEKAILIEKVYPELRSHCREKYGMEFQIVDLHWGGKSNITEDSDLYWEEILQCQNLSAGPTFVSLVGQKYGECPLPSRMEEEDFLALRSALRKHRSRDTRDHALLDHFYKQDRNCTPPMYKLQVPEPKDDFSHLNNIVAVPQQKSLTWSDIEDSLRKLLSKGLELAFTNGNSHKKFQYMISDVEREAQLGIMQYADPANDCLAFYRTIVDIKNYTSHDAVNKYLDVSSGRTTKVAVDEEKEKLLQNMNEKVKQAMPYTNCFHFDVLWKFPNGIDSKLHTEYLDDFVRVFTNSMQEKIDRLSDVYNAPPLPAMMNDIIEHWHLTQQQCTTFVRDVCYDVMQQILEYATGSSQLPVVVCAEEGSGKTSVIAQAAAEAADWFCSECIIAVRYIGKTSLSEDICQLLRSLSLQISCLLDKSPVDIPVDFREVQQYWLTLLKKIPKDITLLVLLDDIHHLENEHYGLSWFPPNLEANVKIVVSVSQSSSTMETLKRDTAREKTNIIYLQPLWVGQCFNLFHAWLSKDKKCIQGHQKAVLEEVFERKPSPMYVWLIYYQVRQWRSDQAVPSLALPSTVAEAVQALFDNLEAKHGKQLTSHCLAYMTVSKTGLSDCEMEDVLSIDDDVLNEVFGGQYSVIRRLPSICWLRLKRDLQPFLAHHVCEGMTVYTWSHSIFSQITIQRYMDDITKRTIHSNLADYFLGVWNIGPKTYVIEQEGKVSEVPANRYVPAQPLVLSEDSPPRYNKRKFDQVPRQLCLAGRLEEFNEHVLFSYEWLYNKAKALSLDSVLSDFMLNPGVEATLVEKALRAAYTNLNKNLNNMAAELTGRLLSYGNTYSNIRRLIHDCDTNGLKQCALIPIFPYHQMPGSPLKHTLICKGNPETFALAGQDSRFILAKDSHQPYVEVYDLLTGEKCAEVLTSAGRIMVTPSGNHFVIVDDDTKKAIKMHDSASGAFLGQFIPLTHIQLKPKEKYKLEKVALCDTQMCCIVSADTSFLCVANLLTFRFSDVKGLEGKANICEITPDSRYVFCNSGDRLLSFDMITMEKMCEASFDLRPKQIVFRANVLRAFLINGQENKVYVIHLKDGKVEMMYKFILEHFVQDQLDSLSMSNNQELLLIKGHNNLVVYHVSTERVVCHIERPRDIPQEFKLPRSHYKSIDFANAAFSADSKFVIGTLFRTIYVWHSANGRLLTTLQAPVGMISDLMVPRDRGQVITHLEGSNAVQVWGLGDAIGHVTGLDRLTAPVEEIKFSSSRDLAYVRCSNSDELGMLNLITGKIVDLLTHPSPVVSFSPSSDGKYIFVTTAPTKHPKGLNKIWYLPERKIIYEFGSGPAFSTPLHKGNSIISVAQETDAYKSPFQISMFVLSEGTFEQYTVQQTLRFVLSEPFVTEKDKYLVLLAADDYDTLSANYVSPYICAVSIKSTKMSTYGPEQLKDVVKISRMLHVRPVPNNSYTIIVLFTNEPDIVSADDRRRRTGYDYCLGFLIFDICSGVVCQVLEDFVTPGTPLNQVIFSNDVSFCIDHESNMFNMGTGFYMKRLQKSDQRPRGLLLGGRAVAYASEACIYVIRVADCERIAHLDLSENVTCVSMGPDDRTVVVGCQSGALLSYALIDEKYDTPTKVLSALRCKSLLDTEETRTWDHVHEPDRPKTSRPRTTAGLTAGLTDKQYLNQIRPVSRMRPTSDTILYLNSRSKTCSVM